MPRINLGTLFDDLGVATPDDFFHKIDPRVWSSLLRQRVIPSLEAEVPAALSHCANVNGLKMHFEIQGSNGHWSNIPNAAFIHKLAFYAEKTVITFPLHELPRWEEEKIRPLVQLICDAKEFIKSGHIEILPQYYKKELISYKMRHAKYGFVSANFHNAELQRQFSEEFSNRFPEAKNEELLNPLFGDIAPGTINAVRRLEKLEYDLFEARVGETVKKNSDKTYEGAFLGLLREIHKEMLRLKIKYRDLQRAFLKQKYEVVLGIACTGLSVIYPPCAPVLLTGLGLEKLQSIIRENMHKVDASQAVHDSQYYVVWRVADLSAKSSGLKWWENLLLTDLHRALATERHSKHF